MKHISYRDDINGLRAIAVIAVVLYHAFPKIFVGGFVGVDIFFVISGFLITSIIYRNLDSGFSFYDFYVKRIKRIFPALLLILVSVIAFGWLVLDDVEYIQIGNHVRSSSLFYLNFSLIKGIGSYFDKSSLAKPLLHLWSLSIEEQFYIIWPLLIWSFHKKNLNQLSLCILLIAISFWLNIRFTSKNSTIAFYSSQCRFWELLIGSVIAYYHTYGSKILENVARQIDYWLSKIVYTSFESRDGSTLRDVASIVGLLINLSCVFFLKKISHFPSKLALLPTIGTALIISAGVNSYVNRKILSNKILGWFGLISYPLYLWHWPILSYSAILEGNRLRKTIITCALSLSILLSWITYKFIETPIRTAKSRNILVILLCFALCAVGFTGYRIHKKAGYPNRYASQLLYKYSIRSLYLNYILHNRYKCQNVIDISGGGTCMTNSTIPKFAVIGDSHSIGFAYEAIVHSSLKALNIRYDACLPFINYFNYYTEHSREDYYQSHLKFAEAIDKLTKLESVEYVILANRGPVYIFGKELFDNEGSEYGNGTGSWIIEPVDSKVKPTTNPEAFVNGYVELINLLISKGKKVIFVIDNPTFNFDMQQCIRRPIILSNKYNKDCSMDRSKADFNQQGYRDLVNQIKKQIPSLLIYDASKVFCDSGKCYAKINNEVLFVDHHHVNFAGSKLIFDDFKQWLQENNI